MPPSTLLREEPMEIELTHAGSGPRLVLVGTGLAGIRSWSQHAERLARSRHVARTEPLAVTLGHAHQPLPLGYSLRMESAALATALEATGWLKPFDVVGWSVGGAIALDFALEHPERVRSLTLIEPASLWVLTEQERENAEIAAFERAVEECAGDVGEEALESLLIAILGADVRPTESPSWPLWWAWRDAARGLRPTIMHRDDRRRLEAFTRPTLIVLGEGTVTPFRLVAEALARQLAAARLLTLRGGHLAPAVDLEAFLAALANFQDQVTS